MEATVEDEKLQGKTNNEDKQKILDKCNEIIHWLEKNQTAEEEEFEHQEEELEKVCNPIIIKLYKSSGWLRGPWWGSSSSGGASSGATIEEVDYVSPVDIALFQSNS